MLIKKSKTILVLVFTLIIFVCFSLVATAIEAPYENVSIGDVIVLSVGIYSENIGDDTSPVFDSQTQNYSEFLEYAEQHGLVEPGKYSSLDADATRLDAVVILYPALSENQYTIINNDFTIPDMSPCSALLRLCVFILSVRHFCGKSRRIFPAKSAYYSKRAAIHLSAHGAARDQT